MTTVAALERALLRWARRHAEIDPVPAGVADRAHRLQRFLGSERDGLLIATGGGANGAGAVHDAALLAAAIGSVRAGGVVVVLAGPVRARTSPLVRRAVAGFAAAARRGVPGIVVAAPVPSFGRRERATTTRFGARTAWPAPDMPGAAALRAHDALYAEAIDGLAPEKAALVVTGGRGRGKSALLGRLCAAAAVRAIGTTPIVTAAARSAMASVERHAGAPVRFLAPDAALRAAPATLFVDEAATLPGALLSALLARHARAVLATTVDGHEAAGRAFALRFRTLTGERPTTALELTEPMRWRNDDPVESTMRRALLLDGTHAEDRGGAGNDAGDAPERPRPCDVEVRRVPPARLHADEALLRRTVRLLSGTHYQSALHDAEHLLAGRLALWTASRVGDGAEGSRGELLGAALVASEGGIDPALAPHIVAGRRRLPDQLLPQLLAREAQDGSALGARYARVVRIAVAPYARRRGIGSALLDAIARRAATESAVDAGACASATGAAFADEPGAAAFWRANGFATFHMGTRINPRSGAASRAVLRPDRRDRSTACECDDDASPGSAPTDVARAAIRALTPGETGAPPARRPVHDSARPSEPRASRC